MTRLVEAIRQAAGRGSDSPASSETRITWETVDAVTPLGLCTVHGRTVPVTGLATFPVGARVPVAWKNGQPVAVIGHRSRRAQFHPSRRVDTRGIVEELLVGNLDNTSIGIWYRTATKLEAITDQDGKGLTAFPLGATPQVVKWGLDGRSFGVQCSGGVYAVYSLSREDANVIDTAAPGSATLLWSGKPLESTIPLTSITYRKTYTKQILQWIGILETTVRWLTAYVAKYLSWGRTEYWWIYYFAGTENLRTGWEGENSATGTATASATQSFPLRDVLAGTLRDFAGHEALSAAVRDWWVTADRRLHFLLTAAWDYWIVGTTAIGTGAVTWPVGFGQNGMEPMTENLSTHGGGQGVIGAQKPPSLGGATVNEQHVFVFDAMLGTVAWATAAPGATIGSDVRAFAGQILEHGLGHDPGFDERTLPSPHHEPPSIGLPHESEGYYRGAQAANLQVWNPVISKDAGEVADGRTLATSSTGTYQLFDPARLPAIQGPYVSESADTLEGNASIIGSQNIYRVTWRIKTGTLQRLWHYRVASVQMFTRRATAQDVPATDEPLLFLVLERYPYVQGTLYINDLPMTWIGVVTASGAIVRVLRDWSWGLNASATGLITANGHRLVWRLGEGAVSPTMTYRLTDLLSGSEQVFTPDQVAQWLGGQARLFTPDFCWDRMEPAAFDLPASLPAIVADDVLADYAALLPADGAPDGSARIVNDEGILSPLDRYQTR